jgi:hypothetical protein
VKPGPRRGRSLRWSQHVGGTGAGGKADAKQPNIPMIWVDDIGITSRRSYSDGLMG